MNWFSPTNPPLRGKDTKKRRIQHIFFRSLSLSLLLFFSFFVFCFVFPLHFFSFSTFSCFHFFPSNSLWFVVHPSCHTLHLAWCCFATFWFQRDLNDHQTISNSQHTRRMVVDVQFSRSLTPVLASCCQDPEGFRLA